MESPRQQPPSNEDLYWEAYRGSHTPSELFEIGGELDERIAATCDDFHARILAGEQTRPTEEEVLELLSLQEAKHKVDNAYVTKTGLYLNGSAVDVPVRNRSLA